jgi:iron complex transport system substrate-binding protein
MKRFSFILPVLMAFAILLSACAQAAPAVPTSTAVPTPMAIAVTDGSGTEIRLDSPAQRVVSLAPSNTEILFALGAGGQMVGREDFSNYPPEAESIPSVGGFMGSYNLEEIASLQPDLILASPLTSAEALQSLKEITPSVFVVSNPNSLDDLYANLNTVGKLVGREAEAATLAQGLQARAKAVLDKVVAVNERPLVFYELDATDPAKPWTAGPGTFIDLLITLAGGQNVGASLSGEWAQISQEELIVQNPDVILLGDALYGGVTAESVAARPGWDGIKAVQENRVIEFNDDLVSRPGPRMIEGLEELAKAIHPGLFE